MIDVLAESPLRVVIVSFPPGLGGPQKWLEEFLPRLHECPALEVSTWYPQGPYQGLAGKVRLARQVRNRFARKKEAVVYLSLDLDLAAQLIPCLRLNGVRRIVVHSHAAGFRIRNQLLNRAYQFLVRRAASWVAVSEQAGIAMFGKGFCARGEVIPTSIDFVGLLQQANEDEVEGTRPGRVFAFIGRLSREKGPDTAIELFRGHVEAYPTDRLLIIGDGPERSRLKQLAASHLPAGSFRFTGAIDNVGHFLKNEIDCILVPSEFEGQCRVVAEAQFFGASVIAANVVPDIAFLNPAAAFRFSVDDTGKWRTTMASVDKKVCAIDMVQAHRLEREAPIGMTSVLKRIEQVVRTTDRRFH